MSNSKLGEVYQLGNTQKNTKSQIIQPRTRKSQVIFYKPCTLSHNNGTNNPEIVRPNIVAQTSSNLVQNDMNLSKSIQPHFSSPELQPTRRASHSPFQRPLKSLSPVAPKKCHQVKKMRNSISFDTSWSPNLSKIENNDGIRHRKHDYYSDDETDNNQYNSIFYPKSHLGVSDDQISPLCNDDSEH